MRIVPIPCLKDNYAYLVVCSATNEAAVVDPSEAAPVIACVDASKVSLRAIWNTHHHFDHVGGNEDLVRHYKLEDVYGHASDRGRIPGQTRFVAAKDSFWLGRLHVRILHIPGHTLGAIAYVVEASGEETAVFTGDTLFLAGCGRLFEGTPAQMHESLSALAELPGTTKVYCGHEYTESNLRFAAHLEPSNADIESLHQSVQATRRHGSPSVPGALADEQKVNPFLRVRSPELRKTLGILPEADDVTAFAAIRKAKDSF
jgi:hydroxyacylglutathione hydrolase